MAGGNAALASTLNPNAPEFTARGFGLPVDGENAAAAEDAEGPTTSDDSDSAGSSKRDEGSSQKYQEVRGQLRPVEPNAWLLPLEVRFSQMRAREYFRCDRVVAETAEEVRAVPCTDPEAVAAASAARTGGVEAARGMASGGTVWVLEAPFPPIAVIRWRCKIRDEKTGRPKVDAATGGELCDSQDRHFTLDNRRLYCLQAAAAKVWPEPALVRVIELPPGSLARSRELRKFRTLDCGRSIFLGDRFDEEARVRWSWRQKVGLEEEVSDATASSPSQPAPHHVIAKRQPRVDRSAGARGGPQAGGRRSRWRQDDAEDEEEESWLQRLTSTPSGGFAAFLVIYILLRLASKCLQTSLGSTPANATATQTRALTGFDLIFRPEVRSVMSVLGAVLAAVLAARLLSSS